ncbi:MAG TPA: iron ABC transporter permease [Roseiflexaceae bacterium]|nr:iron ABC transporter permease [Roseiflexaceae bacterium]
MRQRTIAAPVKPSDATDAAAWPVRRSRAPLVAAAALLLVASLLGVAVGSVYIPPETALAILLARLPHLSVQAGWPQAYERILLDIRLPRVALIGLAGAALACSGAAYQGLFRNPLADPYLIGVAAGAGLGAIGAMALQAAGVLAGAPLAVPVGAFAGALGAVALVYRLGRVGPRTETTTLILAGVAVGTIASALSTFLMLRGGQQVARVLTFLLGGYGGAGWGAVLIVAPLALAGIAAMHLCARPLNLLLFDEDQARGLGVHVERVRLAVVLAATLATAAAVSFAGLIGFVGLVAPHTARMLVGADHRRLMPLATLGGAAFLVLADLVARTAAAPQELPLGVVTALVGAPFFLYLLRRGRD